MPPARRKSSSAPDNFPTISDKGVIAAAEEYRALRAELGQAEKRLKILKPILEAAMRGAPVARAGGCILVREDVTAIPPTPAVTITAAMLGRTIPGSNGRAAHTRLSVL